MTFRLPAVLAFAALVSAFGQSPATTSIFDGTSLAGWSGKPQHWRVEDGAITAEIPAGQTLARNEFLFWEGEVHDFELVAEFRISGPATANSGIQFRSQRLADDFAAGYQADIDQGAAILGNLHDERGRSVLAPRGSRVSIAPDGRRWTEKFGEPADYVTLARPAGEWNTYRILARGPHLELWVNGTRVSVVEDHQTGAADHAGKIALQLHSGAGPMKVQFRNLQLTSLGRTELPRSAPVAAAAAGPAARTQQSPVLWHLRQNPAAPTKIANAAAQKVVSSMLLTEGFQAELIAAEPDVHQPIAFAIDERGRLWVAEAHSYPSKQPAGKGKDRVVIFEDRDGDGAFETRKVFVEGLNLVSGIEVGFGGVWIGAPPELLFIPDRNRDDRPDGPA